MDGPSPTRCWLRPDADDDADANERNMRRHLLLPPSSLAPRSLFPLRQVSIVALSGKNKKAKGRGRGERKQDDLSG